MTFTTKRIECLLTVSIGLMAAAGLLWLTYEFYRLLCQPAFIGSYRVHPGAIDLKIFHHYVHQWALGRSLDGNVYPPASHMMLWPFLGWMDFQGAVWIWTATSMAALAWLVWILLRESGAENRRERIFVLLMPLAIYATGATIGNGQLAVHLLPLFLMAVLLLDRGAASIPKDLAAAGMFVFSLVKPTVSAPFFWIILFRPGRMRPAALVIVGYALLTLAAAWHPWTEPAKPEASPAGPTGQESFSRIPSLDRFFARGVSASTKAGESNVAIWMARLGLTPWAVPVSLCILFLLGLWIFKHRSADIWLLLGVTAIVARFWTYHRWYDDLLILIPMITLFRFAKQTPAPPRRNVSSGVLLGVNMALMIAPGGLYLLPRPWNVYWTMLQSLVWAATLFFLMTMAHTEKGDG